MVHVDESALRGKGGASDLPIRTVKRLLCDGPAVGIVENGNGEPLSIGRKSRTVPTAIRRALDGRDRTCRFPGCSHTKWLDAHHIRHWTDGGETSLKNLVLLCTHHHRLLHEGGFQMLPREGGSYYFAKHDGGPVELAEGQTLAEGEETSALRPWGEGKESYAANMRTTEILREALSERHFYQEICGRRFRTDSSRGIPVAQMQRATIFS